MSIKYHFGIITIGILLSQSFAWAKLGDKSRDVENDKQVITGAIITSDDRSTCYSIKHIDADGQHVREFINKQTDTVFMVASVGRVRIDTSQLIGDANLKEFQNSEKVKKANPSKTHNHQSISAETTNLKFRHSNVNSIYRSMVVLKPATPSCVANPESLL